jgi:DNA-binding LacI/PurR family transcriptional regulator
MHHPFITTIAQPCYELGQTSAQILFERLEKHSAETGLVYLDHQLVVRESTAKKKTYLTHQDTDLMVNNYSKEKK